MVCFTTLAGPTLIDCGGHKTGILAFVDANVNAKLNLFIFATRAQFLFCALPDVNIKKCSRVFGKFSDDGVFGVDTLSCRPSPTRLSVKAVPVVIQPSTLVARFRELMGQAY